MEIGNLAEYGFVFQLVCCILNKTKSETINFTSELDHPTRHCISAVFPGTEEG